MKPAEKRLQNQKKHQQQIIFNEWDDDTPFQWIGNIESVVYRKYELAGYDRIEPIWEESIRSELRFNENCKIIECVRYREGKQCSRRLEEYNNSGELIVTQVFDESGSMISESNYKYSSYGHLIELFVDTPDRKNKYAYIYDTKGKLVQRISYKDGNLNKATSYIYDENGRIVTSVELYPDGDIELIMSYLYFKNGNIKSSMYRFYDERALTHFKYDSKGKIIRTEKFMYSVGLENSNAPSTFVEEWEYDDKGNVIGLLESTEDRIISHSKWDIKYRE